MKKLLFIFILFNIISYASKEVVTINDTNASFNTKEVVTIESTSIEITRDCKLYITQKDGKQKLVPFELNDFKNCTIMKNFQDTPFIVYVPLYGDYLFTIQSIETNGKPIDFQNNTNTNYLKRYVTLLITKEKIYFSKLKKSKYNIDLEDWQLRIESYRIRKKEKELEHKLLEVKHKTKIPI